VEYEEPSIHEGGSRIYTRDYLGGGNPIVLMHGFPDNLHLYDRLVPHVAAVRRVVTFDFLGWGASDKPPSLRPTARSQVGDLDCVVNQLGLERVTLVAHDASGPPAIDWALLHPDRVELLVLLNTYYHWFLGLRRPAAIALYSTPVVRNVGRTIATRGTRPTALLLAGRSLHPGRGHPGGGRSPPLLRLPGVAASVLGAERRPARNDALPQEDGARDAPLHAARPDHLR
jgi:pimeloyl-ACP methyl ester carboxylesterase